MEGNKNRRKLTQDCLAVSEVLGAVLMIAIVVLAFSAISLAVFSGGGEMDPPHTPHTNLQENIERSENTVQVFNSGGDAIDLEDIKIILNVDGQQVEFNMSEVQVLDPDGNKSNDTVFALGDCIVINSSSKVDITGADYIDFYFVHTESSQVIQKTTLWRDFGDLPEWITPYPYGTVYDSHTGKWMDEELVDGIDDGLTTETYFPQQEWIYEEFTFGIDADEMEITDPLTLVLLKIVFKEHDNSANMKLEINNGSSQWIGLEIPQHSMYQDVTECDEDLIPFDITEHVNTKAELESLTVRLLYYGNANESSYKIGWIDFIGVHIEC